MYKPQFNFKKPSNPTLVTGADLWKF